MDGSFSVGDGFRLSQRRRNWNGEATHEGQADHQEGIHHRVSVMMNSVIAAEAPTGLV